MYLTYKPGVESSEITGSAGGGGFSRDPNIQRADEEIAKRRSAGLARAAEAQQIADILKHREAAALAAAGAQARAVQQRAAAVNEHGHAWARNSDGHPIGRLTVNDLHEEARLARAGRDYERSR